MKKIEDIKLFMLDLDGTIYLEDTLIPGAVSFLDWIKENNNQYLFVTNNSSKGKDSYVQKLNNLGIAAKEEDIFTSGDATIAYLQQENKGNRLFLMGTASLKKDFVIAGFQLVEEYPEPVDYVVLGFDTDLTYKRLHMACDYIREGATFIATHPDINCPLKNGKYMPDTGAMIKLIQASTEISPKIMGKPEKQMVESVMNRFGLSKNEIAMVGDRLYTDMKMAQDSDITGIMVLSGEASKEDADKSEIKPDYIVQSVAYIHKL